MALKPALIASCTAHAKDTSRVASELACMRNRALLRLSLTKGSSLVASDRRLLRPHDRQMK